MRHLRAADTALARANARAMVEDWMNAAAQRGGRTRTGWETRTIARRLLSWLSQSPLILEAADRAFYRRFMRSLGQQAAELEARLRDCNPDDRLVATIALAELGLCSQGLDALQRRATRLLSDEIKRQVLRDGGPLNRNPQALVDGLVDLLPLRQAYAARGQQTPAALLNAIDRMLPMLRLFRHADGALALFNGMGVTSPDTVATVLAHDDPRARALAQAPQSGYQRLEAERTVVIVDTGRAPPPASSANAHAGTASFELSADGQRIIVNCGVPGPTHAAARLAARSTAAHSTLVVADQSSSRLAPPVRVSLPPLVLHGPDVVTVERGEDASGLRLDVSHDGYRRLGVIHARRLVLSPDGSRLEGLDTIEPTRRVPRSAPANPTYVLRFHLHPAARPSVAGDRLAITLVDGTIWLFEADAPTEIEESVFFAGVEGTRRTEQITIASRARDRPRVAWSLTRFV